MTDTQALLERLLPHFREDTLGDDDPIVHRTVVDQNDKPVGSEQICLSRLLTHEAFTDDNGTAWTAPTAYAYAKVCKARDKLNAERDAMAKALRLMPDYIEVYRLIKGTTGSKYRDFAKSVADRIEELRAALPVINDKESV